MLCYSSYPKICVRLSNLKKKKHNIDTLLKMCYLNCLSQAHVISKNCASVFRIVLVQEAHTISLVVTQIAVDGGWNLQVKFRK